MILTEAYSIETFPRKLSDSTSEITNEQMQNANVVFELYQKCAEEQDSLRIFERERDSIIYLLQIEISRSKEIEKSQRSEIKNLKDLLQIKDDKFQAYVSSSKKDIWKQNLKTFLINTFVISPLSFGAGYATGYLTKK